MDEVTKLRLVNGNLEEIPNYGIGEYFSEYDSGNYGKLMASIYPQKYVVNYGRKDHYSLIMDIRNYSEVENCWIGSAGDELNFFTSGDDIDYRQFQIIIDILLELKEYCMKTGIDKKIGFSGAPFLYSEYKEFDGYSNASDIDNLIAILNEMKLVRQESISTR